MRDERWRAKYERQKSDLLSEASICPTNRRLFADFFAYQEHKLKRINGLPDLDDGCCKTLIVYIGRFRNVNRWFANKPWVDLTKQDIQKVYDDLEEGRITNNAGRRFEDRQSYYNKVMKSKPFKLAGKDGLVREVIEFHSGSCKTVRYLTEEAFRALIAHVRNPLHLLLLWLAWDIGENINTLLQLTPEEFILQSGARPGEREYIIVLPQRKLKRSRTARSEVTLYPQTAQLADLILPSIRPGQPIFPFGYRTATKFLELARKRSGATTMPNAQRVRWKDFRSGMACHLLKHGWSRDEVNARLGHTPSSQTLNAYINFLALDRNGPKQRMLERQRGAIGGAETPVNSHVVVHAPSSAVGHPPLSRGAESKPIHQPEPLRIEFSPQRIPSSTSSLQPASPPHDEVESLRVQVAALRELLAGFMMMNQNRIPVAESHVPR